jgi:hypothetical protein
MAGLRRHPALRRRLLLSLAVLLLADAAHAQQLARSYANCAWLSVADNFRLYWTYNKTTNIVSMALAGTTQGYLAAGFSSDGTMAGGAVGFSEGWVVRRARAAGAARPPLTPRGTRSSRPAPTPRS